MNLKQKLFVLCTAGMFAACNTEAKRIADYAVKEEPSLASDKKTLVDIAKGYLDETNTKSSAIITAVTLATYKKGIKDMPSPVPVVEIIKKLGHASQINENAESFSKDVLSFIDLTKKYDSNKLLKLLEVLDKGADSNDDSSLDFVWTMDRITSNNIISIDNLIEIIERLDNMSGSKKYTTVLDYADIIPDLTLLMQALDVKQHEVLAILRKMDESYGLFDDDYVTEVSKGLGDFVKFYKISHMPLDRYVEFVRAVLVANDHFSIRAYVYDAEYRLKDKLGDEFTNKKREIELMLYRYEEGSRYEERKDYYTSHNIEDYKFITINVYLTDKAEYEGKMVQVSAVPTAMTENFKTKLHILKLDDDMESLDCFFTGNSDETAFAVNDLKHIIELNRQNVIKRRVKVYGVLTQKGLEANGIDAGTLRWLR